MKKMLCMICALIICGAFQMTAFASNAIDSAILEQVDAIPYTVDNPDEIEELRSFRIAALEKYPGFEVVDPEDIDESLPVIVVNNLEELENLMAGINAAPLYEAGYDVSAWRDSYLEWIETTPETPSLIPSASTNYGDAPAYHQENSTSINCYGYAADFDWWINPGDIYYTYGSQFTSGSTVYDVAGWVEEDFWRADQRPIREITSATASVTSSERRIAVRVGEGYVNIGGGMQVSLTDYHFMRQTSTGRWAHKPGSLPSMYTTITNPSASDWALYGTTSSGDVVVVDSDFYDSEVIYFAI